MVEPVIAPAAEGIRFIVTVKGGDHKLSHSEETAITVISAVPV